jgi:hypothetical protein
MCGHCIVNVIVSVVEGHLFNEKQPIRIRIRLAILMPIQIRVWVPDWHQYNADLIADPSPSCAHFGKLGLIFLLLFAVLADLNIFFFFT